MTSRQPVRIEFEYPTDWLQLDKYTGGLQFVDQRNGDRLHVLRARMPEGETLSIVGKKWFAKVGFDPSSDLVKSGNDIVDSKMSSSSMTGESHRRLTAKYATVTGNGLTVERRGLVDAYALGDDVLMMVTSTNAVKFEQQGRERAIAEAIADSFRVQG